MQPQLFLKFWWPSIVVVAVAIVVTWGLVCLAYGDLETNPSRPRDEIIRNYGLLIAAFWGASLAVWRSQIAKQQVDSTNKQLEISERGLKDARFQKGVEMVGSDNMATRMGGVHALNHLAKNHPEDYLDQTIKVLSAFVRHPGPNKNANGKMEGRQGHFNTGGPHGRDDVWEAVRISGDLNSTEAARSIKPNVMNANLEGMLFRNMDLSGMDFSGSLLKGATFNGCNLTRSAFKGADFSKTHITMSDCIECNFQSAIFVSTGPAFDRTKIDDTDISDADFSMVDINQEQIDLACQNPSGKPPKNLPEDLHWDEKAAVERWKNRTDKKSAG